MGAKATQPRIGWKNGGVALNGGAAVTVVTAGTYVSVATGLSNRALCYIKVQNVTGGNSVLTVRDKEETGNWGHLDMNNAGGVCRIWLQNNEYGAVVVPCNASGDIEITAGANNKNWKLWLMGYIPSI